ncbi:hypothetical protein LJR034_009117 [Caballeronia sp. LjRoot34]|uniref:hypothetical protein n=1 Tax=Caballeronia sp. LjRoot34 TaxID=3342325 RepID=UPI003ED10ABD
MTPRTLKTALGDHTVTVLTGREPSLRDHAMVIETLTGDDEPPYGKLPNDRAVLRLAHARSTCDVAGVATRV